MKSFYLFLIIILILVIYYLLSNYIIDDYHNKKKFMKIKKELDLNKETIDIKEVKEENFIPKHILQIYFQGKEYVPKYVFDKNNPENWKYYFFDEEKINKYLLENYGEKFVKKINSFSQYSHKSDLFRLCWLYQNGGLYLDIDLEIMTDFDILLKNIEGNFTMAKNTIRKNQLQNFLGKLFNVKHDTLLNGIIFVNKGNKLLKKCIENVMNTTQEDIDKYGYGTILYVLQKTVGKDFDYQIEEKYSNGKSFFYDKNNKKIAYQNKKKFNNGKFLNI